MRVRAKKCPRPPRGQTITVGREYWVLGIECGHYRIVNDDGDPVLYEPTWFTVIDDAIPASWVQELVGTAEWTAYPADLNERGFFERYHDGKPDAVEQFRQFVQWFEKEHGIQLGWLPPDEVHRRTVARIRAAQQQNGETPNT
jgi:hypothetical protein